MNKFRNYIYMTICETSIELFEQTNFRTYINYCRCMGTSLSSKNLSVTEKNHILKIFDVLEKIYSLTEVESANFIYDYFNLDIERIITIEKVIRLTKKYYVTGV